MPRKLSKIAEVERALERGWPLTELMAAKFWGVTCMPTTISLLRKRGMKIETTRGPDGFAVYTMEKPDA